jgi:hypothetical protein
MTCTFHFDEKTNDYAKEMLNRVEQIPWSSATLQPPRREEMKLNLIARVPRMSLHCTKLSIRDVCYPVDRGSFPKRWTCGC